MSITIQAAKRRDFAIQLSELVSWHVARGLSGDEALAAIEAQLAEERRLQSARRAAERMYEFG